jgi:type I restriction enzyme S subunit
MAGEWVETTLGAEVDFLMGFPFKSERYTESHDSIRLVRGDNIVQGSLRWDGVKKWPLSESAEHEVYQLREGDVVLAMDRPWIEAGLKYAAISRYDLPCLLVQRTARLRGGPKLGIGFLRYLVGSREFTQHIHSITTGTAVPHISGKQIKDFVFALPPLPEQRAIASVLGALDDKIESNRRTSRALEKLARAIFRAWFVDFEPVKAKAADARSFPGMPQEAFDALPTRLVPSELGPIPEGWGVDTIKNHASSIQYGFTQSAKDKPVGPQFLRITDIRGGKINWGAVPFCEATEKEQEKYRVKDGDIFVARTGASTGDNIYVVEPPAAVFASYLIRIQFESCGLGRLVGEFMQTPDYANHVGGTIGGSAQPNASAQKLAAASMVFPPESLADAFYESVRPLDLKRAANDRESRNLATLRDYLLPRLLSGEVRSIQSEMVPP